MSEQGHQISSVEDNDGLAKGLTLIFDNVLL